MADGCSSLQAILNFQSIWLVYKTPRERNEVKRCYDHPPHQSLPVPCGQPSQRVRQFVHTGPHNRRPHWGYGCCWGWYLHIDDLRLGARRRWNVPTIISPGAGVRHWNWAGPPSPAKGAIIEIVVTVEPPPIAPTVVIKPIISAVVAYVTPDPCAVSPGVAPNPCCRHVAAPQMISSGRSNFAFNYGDVSAADTRICPFCHSRQGRFLLQTTPQRTLLNESETVLRSCHSLK
jgi:hypothetical protein